MVQFAISRGRQRLTGTNNTPRENPEGCSLRVPCRDSSRCLFGLTQYRRLNRSHNNDSREGIERSRCVKQQSRAIDLSTVRFVT